MDRLYPLLCGLALFVLLSITSKYSSQVSSQRALRFSRQPTNLLGILLVGRADIYTYKDWLHRHIHLFDKLAIIDGSYNDLVKNEAKKYENAIVLSEESLNIDKITDQTLRAPAMNVLGDPVGSWILICHPDEFWTIDPRRLVREASKNRKLNLIKVRVVTASPLESEYKKAIKNLANKKNYLEDNFHIMDISNLGFNENGESNRASPFYFENRLFRWEKDMKWGSKHSLVVPQINPRGYFKLRLEDAFYVHFKLHDFSPNALLGETLFTNSQLDTGLTRCNFTHEGWMGSFLDESYPEQLNQYPPRTIETVIELNCREYTNPRWPCELPWNADASFE